MLDIAANLETVLRRIAEAEQRFGREPGSVKLIAVSKTKPLQLIREAVRCGQQLFGENYVQEAVEKVLQIQEESLSWHFIGPIQSNKTKLIAENFDWVHSIGREKIAQRLNNQRPAHLPKLNICLQVNVSDEATKAGASLAKLPALIESVSTLPNLRLRGFMAIPIYEHEFEKQRLPFGQLKETLLTMNQRFHLQMDTLSMGMSGDLEAAIAEGATFVRVGTDIFGARQPH